MFVRNGKVDGCGCIGQGKVHISGAETIRSSSAFCRLYSLEESARVSSKRKGKSTSLLQVVVAGFDPKSEDVEKPDRELRIVVF